MKYALVFGDVHGEAEQLRKLISQAKDKVGGEIDLYSVGDLIDRGSQCKDVVQVCVDEGVKSVVGNHETWMIDYLKTGNLDSFCLHPIMGGKATIESYIGSLPALQGIENLLKKKMPKSHIDFFLSLPMYRKLEIEGKVFWINHAGLKKTQANIVKNTVKEKISEDDYHEIVAQVFHQDFPWAKATVKSPGAIRRAGDTEESNLYNFQNSIQIFGHTIFNEPVIGPGYIGLDTGCGTRGPFTLTGIILPTMEFITVEPEDKWAQIDESSS